VDVSDPDIQRQMNDYVNDLVGMPYISSQPEHFWLRHFQMFDEILNDYIDASGWTFNEKLDLFLDTPPFDVLHSADIVRDSNGIVIASRCEITFDKGSNYDIQVQIDTVKEQRRITSLQPINEGRSKWPFFMFSQHFYAWELHNLIFRDLILTFTLGLISVFVISLLFIPHPFGALVLPPIVGAVYCELMAFLKVVGIHISVVSAIGLLMSIGLVVDYNMHVALAYFENKCSRASRDERVRRVLTTMGASICVGGFTTMASALPLGLTASLAFQTFFFTFLAIPILGAAHGLILLPVIMSLCGPRHGRQARNE
jgi:Niemann-Pick C1 protein